MRVLIVHNRYRTSAPSGEDTVVRLEKEMLAKNGVEVISFDRCNDEIDDSRLLGRAEIAAATIWSQRSRHEVRTILRATRPDVVHVHNTFAMISPSIYGACTVQGVPAVQTLHNFRLFCPGAMFTRAGRPCEDCVEQGLWQSIKHRCYRGSLPATATLASMLAIHRSLGTFSRHISRFIALTQFSQAKAIASGIDRQKLTVKPNFLPDPPAPGDGCGDFAIFVGRLLDEKGVATLLEAWTQLPDVKLKIVGDGALRQALESFARQRRLTNVEFLGMRLRTDVMRLVADAKVMMVPSECYEGFPMVIAESFACGTPVLASRIGSLEELVGEGVRGRLFAPRDPADLARTVRRLLADPAALQSMRLRARQYFDAHLTESSNFLQLDSIYRAAIADEVQVVTA